MAEALRTAALYRDPDEIARKLTILHAAGVRYVLCSRGGGSRNSLRRFAHEIAPIYGGMVNVIDSSEHRAGASAAG